MVQFTMAADYVEETWKEKRAAKRYFRTKSKFETVVSFLKIIDKLLPSDPDIISNNVYLHELLTSQINGTYQTFAMSEVVSSDTILEDMREDMFKFGYKHLYRKDIEKMYKYYKKVMKFMSDDYKLLIRLNE